MELELFDRLIIFDMDREKFTLGYIGEFSTTSMATDYVTEHIMVRSPTSRQVIIHFNKNDERLRQKWNTWIIFSIVSVSVRKRSLTEMTRMLQRQFLHLRYGSNKEPKVRNVLAAMIQNWPYRINCYIEWSKKISIDEVIQIKPSFTMAIFTGVSNPPIILNAKKTESYLKIGMRRDVLFTALNRNLNGSRRRSNVYETQQTPPMNIANRPLPPVPTKDVCQGLCSHQLPWKNKVLRYLEQLEEPFYDLDWDQQILEDDFGISPVQKSTSTPIPRPQVDIIVGKLIDIDSDKENVYVGPGTFGQAEENIYVEPEELLETVEPKMDDGNVLREIPMPIFEREMEEMNEKVELLSLRLAKVEDDLKQSLVTSQRRWDSLDIERSPLFPLKNEKAVEEFFKDKSKWHMANMHLKFVIISEDIESNPHLLPKLLLLAFLPKSCLVNRTWGSVSVASQSKTISPVFVNWFITFGNHFLRDFSWFQMAKFNSQIEKVLENLREKNWKTNGLGKKLSDFYSSS